MEYLTQMPPGASLRFRDAFAAADSPDGRCLISSPNMSFVPEPSVGSKEVCIRADGRFGLEDPVQWPQFIDPDGRWLAAILRRPSDPNHRLQPIWMSCSLHDFVHSGSHFHQFGKLSPKRQDELQPLVREMSAMARSVQKANPERFGTLLPSICTQMEDAFDRLNLLSSYRDIVQQVRLVQRYWLYSQAIITWYGDLCLLTPGNKHPVRPELMGVFSSDPTDVNRLFLMGVPVWYLRHQTQLVHDDVVLSFVGLERGTDILTFNGIFGIVIFNGIIGSKQFFRAISGAGKTYLDVGLTTPPPSATNSGGQTLGSPRHIFEEGPIPLLRDKLPMVVRHQSTSSRSHPYAPVRTGKKPSVSNGRNKLSVPEHQWMTGSIPLWAQALADVDQDRPRPTLAWGYQIPEAFLVIGSQNKMRQASYLRNWLLARDTMAYILSHPVHSAIIPLWKTQVWRIYLRWGPCPPTKTASSMKTKTQAEKFLVIETFQHVFGDCLKPDGQATLFDQPVPEAVDDIPLLVAQQIVWDLHEMGFRLELQLLDRELNAPGG